MVVKMMRWRPWPPLIPRKYEVKLVVRRMEGWGCAAEEGAEGRRVVVEIRWKGPKISLSSLRRTVKRNFTKEEDVGQDGVVLWDEEFQSVCNLSAYKDNVFHPWEIAFTVLNGSHQGPKNKVPVVGTASLNIAEFASAAEEKEFELNIPLTLPGGAAEPHPLLCISLSLLELRTAQEPTDSVQRAIVPVPSSPRPGETTSTEKDELSAIKAGLRKVKIFTEYVSTRRAKKACREEEGSEGRCSARSEDGDYTYPFDSDSLDDFEEGETDEGKEDSSVRKSFSYGTLAYANCAGGSFYSNTRINGGDEDWVYYSNRKSDVGCSQIDDSNAAVSELQSSKRSILSWRKRKLSFRSPKARGALLKKAYGKMVGMTLILIWHKTDEDSSANRSSVSEFGDDNFAIGNWEQKEVVSRDGHMKVQTQVFFASIDQRSERAAGESACTALVAVIANWFQTNRDIMPIKSQFDSLIREGSLEWRNLCDNETYRERFPDKHFDLDTVLEAKIRPLSVVPGKSFIGFSIQMEWMRRFDFCKVPCPLIVFGMRLVMLGQNLLATRLYEGCDQAYILKFDRDTKLYKLSSVTQPSDEKPGGDQQMVTAAIEPKNRPAQQVNPQESSVAGPVVTKPEESTADEEEAEVVCQGKESCKEYIKNFLAAIPIRELQADIKKGLMASTPLHHRLQIEFHYTQLLQPAQPETEDNQLLQPAQLVTEVTPDTQQIVEVAIAET
ncbi:hypothetical protein AAG906_011040 [Vitis piasezkii]